MSDELNVPTMDRLIGYLYNICGNSVKAEEYAKDVFEICFNGIRKMENRIVVFAHKVGCNGDSVMSLDNKSIHCPRCGRTMLIVATEGGDWKASA